MAKMPNLTNDKSLSELCFQGTLSAVCLTFCIQGTPIYVFGKGEDPDEMWHNATFQRDLHFLLGQKRSSEEKYNSIWKL